MEQAPNQFANSTSDDVSIRAYEGRDRSAIRRICCDTAARGEPVERFFPDREVFADFVTRYYTDYEPSSVWVVERNGKVVGYLTGCLDSRRYRWVMGCCVIPRAVIRAIIRGVWLYDETWRLFRACVSTWRLGGFDRDFSLERYPAHLHVNMQSGFRGQHVGQQLVERFIQKAIEVSRSGIHVVVRGDNTPACRLFERLGFIPLCRYSVVLSEDHEFRFHETILYGKQL